MPSNDPTEGHAPNQTTTTPHDPSLPAGTPPLPRDPNQAIHKKPRVFIHRPNEDPDEEVAARENTSLISAMRTINTADFSAERLGKMPCFRDAMLPSIGSGVGVGIVRFVVGGSIFAACNWASGSFLAVSLFTYNVCQRARRKEKDNIRQAVKVLDEKQRIKDAEVARVKEEKGPAAGSFWGSFKFW